jgi:DNA-binding LacI/PurR family transcriptional regulator
MIKKKPPTISDVAQRAKVSIATVSRVLNSSAPVAKEKARSVHQAIQELNYVPRSAARILASQKTRTIGLILPEISGAFFPPILRGIEAEATQAGYDLLINTTQIAQDKSLPFRTLGEHNTDGVIIFTASLNENTMRYLFRIGFPMVLLHQTPPEDMQVPLITIENKSGARKIVEHLIEVHGCHRIAFLRGPDEHEDSKWREKGYREALQAHDIPLDSALIANGGFDENEARNAVEEWLLNGIEFEAIFCGDDDAAIGVLAALQQAGKQVPEEVAVVGFDDVPVARFLVPPLTTVCAPIEQVGREAVQQLIKIIKGESADLVTLLPTSIVIRQSCGCPSK